MPTKDHSHTGELSHYYTKAKIWEQKFHRYLPSKELVV